MRKILFGTGNQTRLEYLRGILTELPIHLVSLKDENIFTKVEEVGASPLENSIIKAKEYFKTSNLPTFSIDSGLYIDKFPLNKQPGVFVRRIKGMKENITDTEMLKYYIDELNNHGGESKAYWKIALTFVIDKETVLSTVFERETILTSNRCEKMSPGEPLNAIQIDLKTGKYLSELSIEEKIESQIDMVQHIQEFMKEKICLLQ